ncbi:MAG TPA: DUF1285 domain-containing protein [Dongiaceae bacterium]|jgi:hypothetical protein
MQRNPSSGDLSNPESGRREQRHDPGRMGAPDFSQLPSCGDFDMRIARDGTWFYRGSPIGRKPLVKLFSTVLRRENGEFWLVTPVERGRILVDDAPFVAVAVDAAGEGSDQTLTFRTNVDDEVIVDAAHPIRVSENPETGESVPYINVRNGLEARILRPVYYHLVELGEFAVIEGAEQLGVWSAGTFFPLGRTEEN